MYAFTVHKGSATPDCCKEFVTVTVVNNTDHDLAFVGGRNRGHTERHAVHKVGRSVNGIYNPQPLVIIR
jgi:hypothetical protein